MTKPTVARAMRARALADRYPAVDETLRFYAWLAELQAALSPSDTIVKFSEDIARVAPASLRAAIRSIQASNDDWRDLIATYWTTGGRDAGGGNDVQLFLAEAFLQPFAESGAVPFPASPTSPTCPFCDGPPVVALLREEGHGARRSLVCAMCLAERPAQRLTCVACGESRSEALVAFTAEEFDHARIDACATCKAYIKTIDLTRDGNADPIVDDLATLPLDLWVREQGYQRGRPNILRV